MSIRWKMATIGIAAVLMYALADLTVQYTFIGPSFEDLERAQASSELDWVRAAFNNECKRVRGLTQSLGKESQDGIPVNSEICVAHNLNLMIWVDRNGKTLRYASLDLLDKTPLLFPELPEGNWASPHPLLTGAAVSGIFPTGLGALIVAASPVEEQGGPGGPGTLIVGRLVTPAFIQEIGAQLHVETFFSSREGGNVEGTNYTFSPEGGGKLRGVFVVNDLFGHPSFELGVRLPRTITHRGETAQRLDGMGGMAVGLVAMVFLLIMLQRAVTEPLGRLLRHVRGIRESGSLAFVDMGSRQDDFGALANEFNQMVAKLEADAIQRKRMQGEIEEGRRLAELGELGASMAHEIRNPLAGISGALQVLRGAFSPEDERSQIIEETLAQIMRVENTVRRLLDYAKPWYPSKQSGDLRDFVRKSCEAFARQALPEECRCEVENGSPIKICFDSALLQQVLENVVYNASQAMPGGGTIRISFFEEGGQVEVRVRDEGPGLPDEALSKAFDPFFTTKSQGAGLGLSVCRRIIEAHGGHILITNANPGAEVQFSLPRGTTARPTISTP